ncbi:hypothetical protein B0H63DRAFT_408500 [Podospora didyma]|uniref:DUF6603 domain-containing protein n=1 Tax=Podospora didyma TaxID=330526 RepID=A0AAE0P8G5_9PEZI|nr:hypothetical protein B0H63DRAFT_408500 [Podospora didyma]
MVVEITPYQRRLVAVVPGAGGRLAGREKGGTISTLASTVAAATDTKYYIYSSKSGKSSGGNVHVLSPSPKNIDDFLSLLPDEGIALTSTPTVTSAVLDASDKWATWMTNWDASGELSVHYDDPKTLNFQWFEFSIKAPWKIVFSSKTGALNFAFGVDPVKGALVPVPGVADEGTPLYFGLDPVATTSDPKSSVADLFTWVGLDSLGQNLPIKGLSLIKTTLKRASASESRNALWFSPEQQLKATMRLQFELDSAKVLSDTLTSVLPGLEFQKFSIACKKVLVLGETSNGKEAIAAGDVEFEIDCSVKTVNTMELSLRVFPSSLELNFKMTSPNAFAGIVGWIVGLLPGDAGADTIEKILTNLFKDHFFLHRLTVSIDTSGSSPSLAGLSVDIEVAGKFGQGSNESQMPAFLISYNWAKGFGDLGSINGDFWTYFNSDKSRVLDPNYRAAIDIQPFTTNPATEIDLITLIPGQKIENVPANVPTKITAAGLYLSQEKFSFKTTLQSADNIAGDQASDVPQIDLGRIDLAASYTWGKASDFTLHLGITSILTPSTVSKHQDSAILSGTLDYSSGEKTWKLHASLEGLYASTLAEFFDKESVDHVIPLIDSLMVDHLTLDYQYTGTQKIPGNKSVGTYFNFDGLILCGGFGLKLTFNFEDKKGWKFTADLQAEDKDAKLGDILEDILGESLDIPPFLRDTTINGKNNEGGIHIVVERDKGDQDAAPAAFQFMASIQIGELALTFAQVHLTKWDPKKPSKRLIKFALVGLPDVDIPLVGNLTQPFDEMYLMWVQDGTELNKASPGLTREEVGVLNKTLEATGHPLVPKDKYAAPDIKDVLVSAGAHFAIVLKDQQGVRTCVLDYDFKKAQPKQQQKKQGLLTSGDDEDVEVEAEAEADEDEDVPDSDGQASSAPFKKKAGPLQISNVGLKYADKTLHLRFTATFELGPLAFSLIGFSLNVEITSLDISGIRMLAPSLEGLSASFEKPPLTIAGLIRHGEDKNGLPYYAGGIIVGWVPYQLQAAGFYGEAVPEGGKIPDDVFSSFFLFARLDGPLVTLEFAEISGVTGGFGYKSEVRVPTADQVVNFPFVKSTSLAGATESALTTLERLTSPAADGWFKPRNDTYWAAAGMKIDAFQMLSLDAVAVVQFGQSMKMGLFAVALADIPSSASPVKFAHVELGIAVVIDLDYGTLKAEAQLSPNSYILDPNCHLTGGFALYYWFDAPHADRSLTGDFVFTLGGYHQAFKVPPGYPNPPRLGISWSLGKTLSITGQSYFAITPKACMGGGRWHAAFHAGPIEAWFDVFADFLINYKPFHFLAEAGISVGVRFNLDIWFIHIHISVEVGADLTLWGPPVAGRVRVDIKVAKFSINFGSGSDEKPPASLLEFYQLVLQQSSKTDSQASKPQALAGRQPLAVTAAGEDSAEEEDASTPKKNEGHTFLAQSGLMNDTDKPDRTHNQDWTVRGGTFSFILGCKMAIAKAEQVDEHGVVIPDDPTNPKGNPVVDFEENTPYARPMKLSGDNSLESTVTICITQKDSDDPARAWPMEQFVKSVPTGLWAEYDPKYDPKKSGNNIDALLDTADGSVPLMMGVLLFAPPPIMSADTLQTFKILDADWQDLPADKYFPAIVGGDDDWVGEGPLYGAAQWNAVHAAWKTPDWDKPSPVTAADDSDEEEGSEEESDEEEEEEEEERDDEEGGDVQTSFVSTWASAFGWSSTLSSIAKIPSLLDKRFDELYVASPLLTK